MEDLPAVEDFPSVGKLDTADCLQVAKRETSSLWWSLCVGGCLAIHCRASENAVPTQAIRYQTVDG